MGRESSHETKEHFNLPPLVLKARHLAKPVALPFAGLSLREQAMRWMVDFGRDHLPYVVLAIFMFITFNLLPFYCFVSIPVDAFSPVLTAVDSTVRCCVPSWMLFKAATSSSHTTVDAGPLFTCF